MFSFSGMDDKKLLNENELKCNDSECKDDFELRMGIRSWRPDWLQRFNTMKWFVFIIGVTSATQGTVCFK